MVGLFFSVKRESKSSPCYSYCWPDGTLVSLFFLWQWYLTVSDTVTDSWLILITPVRCVHFEPPEGTDCQGRQMVTVEVWSELWGSDSQPQMLQNYTIQFISEM